MKEITKIFCMFNLNEPVIEYMVRLKNKHNDIVTILSYKGLEICIYHEIQNSKREVIYSYLTKNIHNVTRDYLTKDDSIIDHIKQIITKTEYYAWYTNVLRKNKLKRILNV